MSTDMFSAAFPLLLLCAHITGLDSVQLLNATVRGSVTLPCSTPVQPTYVTWFYWQEDKSSRVLYHWVRGQTEPADAKYRNRCGAFSTEISSGNTSIRLDNVTVEDDQKTFWAYVSYQLGEVPKRDEKCCKSMLQVFALYQDQILRVDKIANRATCTASGGYPEPLVSWTGVNKSSAAELDLQDAETTLQKDPTEKTFSVTSSVSVKDLQAVTCSIYNPRSNQSIKETAQISASDADQRRHHWACVSVIIFAVIVLVALVLLCYRKRQRREM